MREVKAKVIRRIVSRAVPAIPYAQIVTHLDMMLLKALYDAVQNDESDEEMRDHIRRNRRRYLDLFYE